MLSIRAHSVKSTAAATNLPGLTAGVQDSFDTEARIHYEQVTSGPDRPGRLFQAIMIKAVWVELKDEEHGGA